jgi:ribosomal protein S12 methylthiotransferase accessory factor
MIRRPTFKTSFHVEIVDSEGVYLLSEREHFLLKGQLNCRLAPLLDGTYTADEIVDRLAGEVSPARVYYALRELEQKGYIVEAADSVPRSRASFWHALGWDAQAAEERLRQATVSLASYGNVPVEELTEVLRALDLHVVEDGALAIVLADDYLQDGLDAFNRASLAANRPWLLVKPVGTVFWLGPLFRPGVTGCWECLAQRLRANRVVEAHLQRSKKTDAAFTVSRATLPVAVRAALELTALEAVKAIAGGPPRSPENLLVTLDWLTMQIQKHVVVRRPQCPACGALEVRADLSPAPPELRSRPKGFTLDGGHRVVSPAQTVARYEHHISPLTGAVLHLDRVESYDDTFYAYISAHSPILEGEELRCLREGLRTKSGGKGVSDAQARASALCEALERYSGTFQGDENRKQASYRELRPSAIHPNACMLYSEDQYRRRHHWNSSGSRFQMVPEPFDERTEIEWSPVWSLTRGVYAYLPTSYGYFGYPKRAGRWYARADSNGNAAGNTLEEAILQGFLELVERDSVAIWWYNRISRPGVDLHSFAEPSFLRSRERHLKDNRDLWVLDLTGDLGVPAFAAISRRMDREPENIMLGFGAHFDPKLGILRALTEINQFATFACRFPERDEDAVDDPALRAWWHTARIAEQPYLAPAQAPPRVRSDYNVPQNSDLLADVRQCQAIVERHGLDLLFLDQTRPDIGLPVVKVIVPGLRPVWARYAPGRLYDVPVKLGWLKRPLAEGQLNPIPFCF